MTDEEVRKKEHEEKIEEPYSVKFFDCLVDTWRIKKERDE